MKPDIVPKIIYAQDLEAAHTKDPAIHDGQALLIVYFMHEGIIDKNEPDIREAGSE